MKKDGCMQAETTLRYYDSNAQSFAADTIGADMSSIQDAFLSLLHSGARILDLGCGTGRDSRYFLLSQPVTDRQGCVKLPVQTPDLK